MEAAAESKLCHRARGEWMMDRPKHALIQEKATTIAHARRRPKKARGSEEFKVEFDGTWTLSLKAMGQTSSYCD